MKRISLAAALLALLTFFVPVTRAEDKVAAQPVPCTPAQKNPDRHEKFLKDKTEALKTGPIDVVFLGDSITDGWRLDPQHTLFVEKWGKHNPLNLGISGDRTEHVLWRLEHGEVEGIKPKLVVLMIGTNNLGNKVTATPEETAAGVKCVVASLREKLPETKVLLLAVFPRGKKATDSFRGKIKTVNDTIAKLDDGKDVKYLDISDKFLAPDGTLTPEVMPDSLHPNEKGYQIWADAISDTVDEMVK